MKIKFTKTQSIIKAILIDIFKISLTQKSVKLKGNITRICHVSYLISDKSLCPKKYWFHLKLLSKGKKIYICMYTTNIPQ